MSGEITWSELVSQPAAWHELLGRLEAGTDLPAIDPAEYDEILLVGSGTSYYLALAAADWIRRRHHVPVVRALPSCEIMLDAEETKMRHGARRLAIGFSRSGESSELILAFKSVKLAGFDTLAIGCTRNSSLMALADRKLFIAEGQEDGLVMLRSFTGMLLAVQYLFGTEIDRAALSRLPEFGQSILDGHAGAIGALANRQSFDRFVFLASGPSYPIAVEASLKIQEMSISTSEAYHSLEYRHGPKATADAETLVALIPISDPRHGTALARDIKALGATLVVCGANAEDYSEIADLVVAAPEGLSEAQASVLALLTLQIMAFETAMRLGNNPDAPSNLSKVVTF